MSLSIFDKRPPFVRFEEREMGLNAEATRQEGRPIPRMVIMACITPHGSKDSFEQVADDWIEKQKQRSLSGEAPAEWYNHFALQLSEWKKGNELPREGTPIKTWAMCTGMDGKHLIATGITTVEDLAAFPDTNLGVIGMNGRYLRDMARGWLAEAKDKGANAKALADANVEIATLKETIERQTARIDRLAAKLEAQEEEAPKRGPGRPRKDAEAA